MKASTIALVCGKVISVSAALGIGAQPTSDPPGNTTNRNNPHAVQPTPVDRNRTIQTGGAEDAILRKLEGMWRVDVSVNPAMMPGMDRPGLRGDDAQRVPSATAPDRDVPKSTNPSGKESDGSDRATRPATPNETATAGNTNPPTITGGKSFSGYAKTNLMMDGNVLEEHVVVPGMSHFSGMKGTTPSVPPRSTEPGASSNADNNFHGLMVLSFDDSNRTYGLAFVCNETGKMHYGSGSFDATGRRLVFHSMGPAHYGTDAGRMDHDRMNDDRLKNERDGAGTNPNRGSGGTSDSQVGKDSTSRDQQPGGTSNSQVGKAGENVNQSGAVMQPNQQWRAKSEMMGGSGVRVVVELLGNDQHRVTAYRSGAMNTESSTTNTGANSMTFNNADIIYTATFTRVSGSDADRVRDMFKDDAQTAGKSDK